MPKRSKTKRSLASRLAAWASSFVLGLSFVGATSWSSLFILSRFITAIMENDVGAIIVYGLLTLGTAYACTLAITSLALMFWLMRKGVEDDVLSTRSLKLLKKLLVTNQTVGGEVKGEVFVVSAEERRQEQLLSRMEALESAIEGMAMNGMTAADNEGG